MKIILFLLSMVALCNAATKDCPAECVKVQTCAIENNLQKFTLYPPKGNIGKCFCENYQDYYNCLHCSKVSENKEPYNEEVVRAQCNNIVSTPVQPATPATPATGANAGANSQMAGGNTNNIGGVNNAGQTNTIGQNGSNISNNSTMSDNGKNNENEESKGGSKIGIIVVCLVAAAGVAGFVFYTRKQKNRPESMPFFGNTAASPNQYATLSTPKEMSNTNLTSDYGSQYFNDTNAGVGVPDNQYYNQNNNYNYDQNQDYGNQYDQNYQNYSNQYPATSYENEVVNNAGMVDTNNNYESRRESMVPGAQGMSNNFTGLYVCTYKYDPQLDDELALQVNDQVQIIEEYEDGWMKATNLTTGKEGMAPRVCIKEA